MPQQLSLFDPLVWLRSHSLGVTVTPAGSINLHIDWRTSTAIAAEAKHIAKDYAWLIKLQLAEGGVSIHKLYAMGKVRLKGGKVVEVPHT